MSQNDDDVTTDDEQEPNWIKDLRKKAKEHDSTAAERDELRRELTLHRAGLGDLTDRQRKALLASADGNEIDDLKSAATELGFLKAEAPADPIPAAEQAAHQRVEAAAAGAEAAPALTDGDRILEKLDPRKLTEDEFWANADSMGLT